jgi:hypothetical protein
MPGDYCALLRMVKLMNCLCEEESYDLILEADIGADPVWCKKCGCNLDIDEIPISQELKDELVN